MAGATPPQVPRGSGRHSAVAGCYFHSNRSCRLRPAHHGMKMAPPSPVRVDDSSRGLDSGVRRNDGCGRLTSIFVSMTVRRLSRFQFAKSEHLPAQQVLDRLRWLADNVESVRHKALTAQLKGAFSLRVGDYRAIYSLDRTQYRLVVHFVRHRSKVYRLR